MRIVLKHKRDNCVKGKTCTSDSDLFVFMKKEIICKEKQVSDDCSSVFTMV